MVPPAVRSRAWRSAADTAALQGLLSRRLAVDWPAVQMHPGDLAWATVQAWGAPDRPGIRARARLWFEAARDRVPTARAVAGGGGDPIAFALFAPPHDLELVVDARVAEGPPGTLHAVARGAVAWAVERSDSADRGERPAIRAWAARGSAESLAYAEAALAATEADAYVQLTGPAAGAAIDPIGIPAGLSVRPIRDGDVAARVECSRAAFPTSTMTPDRYRHAFSAGSYRRQLDLIVVDGADAVLAFALGWLDPVTGIVELEPVGVHPDHHRRGLGTLVCRSVLRAARDLGAGRVMITADRDNAAAIGLYRSLGLAVTSVIVPFSAPGGNAATP